MTLPHVSTGDAHVSAHNAERDNINTLSTAISSKIDKPTTPLTGDVLVYNGTTWDSYNIRYFSGTGAPNGQVAAPVGSRYTDYAGTAGAVEWVKASGSTGNTGWLLVAGDTGVRNVGSLVETRNNGVVYGAKLRRSGNLVDLYFDIKMPTVTTSPYTALILPLGFRPAFSRYGGMQDNNESAAAYSYVTDSGYVNLYNIVGAARDRFNGFWLTDDAWPSTRPGTAG